MEEAAVSERIASWRSSFRTGVEGFHRDRAAIILTHHDADGLATGVILQKLFDRIFRLARVQILGRGENPWSEAVRSELGQKDCGGLIVADLGTRPGVIRADTPTILIDHHVPMGFPAEATVISGHGVEPTPTSGLLAWWCAQEFIEGDDLLWLAAVSIIGDMGEKAGFEELAIARRRHGLRRLKEAVSLLNAARRAGSGNAQPAFDLLLKAEGPEDVTSGRFPETSFLLAARDEVQAALEAAKRVAPKGRGQVAIIRLHTRCQVHPLVAQLWRARLKNQIVLVANTGYREGWVHFAVRSATGVNLIQFLKDHAPAGADENYGSGHEQATGGALRPEAWNEFVTKLGFGPETRYE